MTWMPRTALGFGLGTLLALTSSAGYAQSCASDNDCAINQICEPGWFGGSCVIFGCSSNAQCFPQAPRCIAGACNRVLSGGPSSSGGLPLSGEGERCGPRRLGGGVIKTIPCRSGLRCVHGFCEKPLR